MTAMETHKRLFELIMRHGTESEQAYVRETMTVMRMMRLEEPTSSWEPIDELLLPTFIIGRARRVALERQKRARDWALRNKGGIVRSLDEEIRSVEAQHAVCIMLGLEFGAVTTHTSAKAHGNVGSNVSAHCPRPGSYSLLISDKEPPTRKMFLLYQEGDHRYSCRGWVRAGEVMRDEYSHSNVRLGIKSEFWLIPTAELSPIRAWFD